MEILLSASVLNVSPSLPNVFVAKNKRLRASPVFCFGLDSYGDLDVHEDLLRSMSSEPKKKHSDIWQLFREAQRNILYINKKRLMALAGLELVKKENLSLLDRIEELEAKELLSSRKDTPSISSELLLRIDSMVLAGTVSNMEALDLRRLVMESRMSVADSFFEITHKNDAELLAELRHYSHRSKKQGFHVIHICTEMAPVISVGSLASYVTGLSLALQKKGHLVEVILPKYANLNLDEVQGLREVEAEFYSFFEGQFHPNRIWTGVVYGIAVTFIQPVYYSSFFSHERIYGYANDFERFTYFSRASLDYIVKIGKQPDVLHIHNWETSIIGPLFWDVFVNQGLGGTRILLTCQGFEAQCLEEPQKLALCGLEPSKLHRPDRLQDNSKLHLVNILKGGIVYSNHVIVMSTMQTKGHIISASSPGLEPTLAIHKDKMLISPHGFEKSIWDPSVDQLLPQSFNAEDMQGKSVCKISLQQHLGLTERSSIILVGCVYSDLSDFDTENLKALVWMASRNGVQFVFMAYSNDPVMNRELEYLQEELKGGDVRYVNKYDEALLHLIFAGSDIMLCPSFDDPVLQLPLKAMRYGTAPIAVNFADNSRFRQYGEHDLECTKVSQYMNNSFTKMSLSQAIDELVHAPSLTFACSCFLLHLRVLVLFCIQIKVFFIFWQKNYPSQWNRRITDAMTKDFSWDAECYDVHVSAYTEIKNL